MPKRPQPITFMTEPCQRRGDKCDWLRTRGHYETIISPANVIFYFYSNDDLDQTTTFRFLGKNQFLPVYLLSENGCSNRTSKILTVLYFPFGIALVIIRLFITLHALLVTCILPKSSITSTILKNIFGVIGIHVVVQEDKRQEKKAKVLVSNHVSNLDHMVIDFVIPNITPDMLGFSPMMQWLTGFKDFGTDKGTDVLEANIQTFVQESKHPVLLHPEKTTTNGSCLLKFRLLPEEVKKDNESEEEFSERVRQDIANSLGIPASDFTESDKLEYIKKIEEEEKQQKLNSKETGSSRNSINHMSSGSSGEVSEATLEQMFLQVREVLPDTSEEVVKQDLRKTRDVDVTIANILEGHVTPVKARQNIASQQPKPTVLSQSSSASTAKQKVPSMSIKSDPSNQKYGAQTFSNTASSRMLSLQERKQIMLASARQRYKEKHGLL
ncbi:hypothetical protein FSP39_010834 [Pinctada imbricata]|uniref:CUE domain-containing protein n=1 Tax=Pinctada imbricata TaxID=66713 RepID=A0AA88XYX4_PINIB|nr:hypothetical protein FSP39_010834 [Pinctada imbricata]